MAGENGNGDGERPLTLADLAEFKSGLDELRERFDELEHADTPAERKEAREEVADARGDLEATAKRLGISRKTLEESVAAARRAERKEELRPILAELLEEEKAKRTKSQQADEPEPGDDDEPDDDDDEPAGDEKPSEKPRAARSRPRSPKPDTEPVSPHWTEKPLSELIR